MNNRMVSNYKCSQTRAASVSQKNGLKWGFADYTDYYSDYSDFADYSRPFCRGWSTLFLQFLYD